MGTVYFLAAIAPDHETVAVKIGFSGGDLNERIRNLQTASPFPLDLYSTMPGTKRDERELHKRFADHRLNGEWFKPDPVMAFIAEKDGWGRGQ